MQRAELMAPAGSLESLMAAIKAGCNSVYFGVEQLNMRARSSINFTVEDLKQISLIAKENNIKTYLTLNTILYDHDMVLMRTIIDAAKEHGITAIICADHAAMSYAKQNGVETHISTQCNITNIETVEFYSAFADVMVLSRELSLKQISSIVKEIQRRHITGPSGKLVEVEVFVHGALCMAVSGKCYLSLHHNNASANRGACIQNCRRSYLVIDKEEGHELEIDNEYIMSAKDLCTITFLDKILKTGVGVLKIEGRGRSADYVYNVTRCYREALDSIYNGSFHEDKINQWMDILTSVYNRGFWEGYYLGRKLGEWNNEYGSNATKRKIYIGRGLKYYTNQKIGEFIMETSQLQTGDQVIITGPTTGYLELRVDELRKNNENCIVAKKGECFTMPVQEKIRPSDRLYKLVEAK